MPSSSLSDVNELLLLGLLDAQRMHGYELHECLEHRLGFVSDLKKPTAYRILERLHEQGLVDGKVERAGRRPERLVYWLTDAGRARLRELLKTQLASAHRSPCPSNVALLFCDRLPPAERRELLSRRRAAMGAQREALASAAQAHSGSSAPRLVIEHDLALVEAELAWLDGVLAPREVVAAPGVSPGSPSSETPLSEE
jgi:DNA-binding PadR family transcriptional regulator